jgi:hypothetical protein
MYTKVSSCRKDKRAGWPRGRKPVADEEVYLGNETAKAVTVLNRSGISVIPDGKLPSL